MTTTESPTNSTSTPYRSVLDQAQDRLDAMEAVLEASARDPLSVGAPDALIPCPTCGVGVAPATTMRNGWHDGDQCPEVMSTPEAHVVPVVDSTAMTTTATPTDPDITPPPGAEFVDDWGSGGGDRRVILGANHSVTDSDVTVSTSCIQHLDGHIDDGTADGPSIYIDGARANLNSDQARELAAMLLQLATQIDAWVQR